MVRARIICCSYRCHIFRFLGLKQDCKAKKIRYMRWFKIMEMNITVWEGRDFLQAIIKISLYLYLGSAIIHNISWLFTFRFISYYWCWTADVQISLLLCISSSYLNSPNPGTGRVLPAKMETVEEVFNWLAVLWDRGFCHDNPQGTTDIFGLFACSIRLFVT